LKKKERNKKIFQIKIVVLVGLMDK